MTIRTINATFESAGVGDYATVEDAYRAAVLAGLKIATEEVSAGSESSIVHIAVDLVGQRQAAQGAVAVSTARLLDMPAA